MIKTLFIPLQKPGEQNSKTTLPFAVSFFFFLSNLLDIMPNDIVHIFRYVRKFHINNPRRTSPQVYRIYNININIYEILFCI